MPATWKKCKLGDVLTLQRGFDLPERDRQNGVVPVVSSSGITGYHNVAKVQGPGVVTGRYGTLGEIFYVRQDFWPLNTTLYVRDFKRSNPLFVSYFLRTLNFSHQNAAGAVPGLNRNALHLLDVSIPPLRTQQKIAGILSAYDDLIENNTRRIAILEEMARMLYQEWFVNFRFPGHENVKMVESSLGLIPDGWTVKRLDELVLNFDSKRKPLSSIQRAEMRGNYPYYGAAKVFDYVDAYIFDGKYLLIAEDGSVITKDHKPVLQFVKGKFWANNHTHVVQGKSFISTEFLYIFLSQFDISGYITGAAQPKITQANLNRILIPVPPEPLFHNFNKYLELFFSILKNLETKNSNLRRTRDMLLPKLISGEIDVSSWVEDVPLDEVDEREALVAAAVGGDKVTRYREPSNGPIKLLDVKNMTWHSLWEE